MQRVLLHAKLAVRPRRDREFLVTVAQILLLIVEALLFLQLRTNDGKSPVRADDDLARHLEGRVRCFVKKLERAAWHIKSRASPAEKEPNRLMSSRRLHERQVQPGPRDGM